RYITARFLPDKAIDLIDEAASRLRMEMDSVPLELAELQDQITQLEIERRALEKEKKKDEVRQRLDKVVEKLGQLTEQATGVKLRWENEKSVVDSIRDLQEKLEKARNQEQLAQRDGKLEKVAELRYGLIVELEKELDKTRQELNQLHEAAGRLIREEVTADDIAEIVSKWTGIPVSRMLEKEREKIVHLEERLAERVIGQSEAIEAVSSVIRRSRAGLHDPQQPLGSFIFLGPTGVGKTELAKALAEQLFDDENVMVRIDMSEFMEKHAVSRLLGAPPGYVGYEEGGYLTEAVRRNPYAVVLFDEIEKAHPDVFNVLLQLLDDGHLTDSQGHKVDFKNTIVILTSNLGSQFLAQRDSISEGEMARLMKNSLKEFFRPEFLNRLDEIIVFHFLSPEDIRGIVKLQIASLSDRMKESNIQLEVSDQLLQVLADKGYDPEYGARSLKRLIQKMILNPLAKNLIENKVPEGSTILADWKSGLVYFESINS
ncbi:MAG: AAA family ATPase, partial [Candidatus Krumholzibacteriota bacterium]|nr:AAA family ATPase [Candidatus Krumholzibacteriota bacterium]